MVFKDAHSISAWPVALLYACLALGPVMETNGYRIDTRESRSNLTTGPYVRVVAFHLVVIVGLEFGFSGFGFLKLVTECHMIPLVITWRVFSRK